MADFKQTLNDVIDDNIEDLFGDSSKTLAKMVEQGLKSAQSVAIVEEDTSIGITYIQYKNGTILKYIEAVNGTKTATTGYKAEAGTLWVDRVTATYTSEVQ